MKKVAFVLLSCLVFSLCAVAQDGRERPRRKMDKEQMVERMTQRQTERLSLTPEQAEKMKVLNLEYMNQMEQLPRPERVKLTKEQRDSIKALRKEGKIEDKKTEKKDERREAMDALRESYNNKVKEVLTPEQYTKFEEMQKERPQGRRPDGMRRGGPRGMGGDSFGAPTGGGMDDWD